MAGEGGAGLTILAVAVGAYWWFQQPAASDAYVTIYERYCSNKSAGTYDDCSRQAGAQKWVMAREFRVDYDKQRVFELGLWPVRYDKCVVADALNWSCVSNEGTKSVQVAHGKLSELPNGYPSEQISWLNYTLYK